MQNNNNNNMNMIKNAIEVLSMVNQADLENMSYEELKHFSDMDLLMNKVKFIAARKRCEEESKDEIALIVAEQQKMLNERANENATVQQFDANYNVADKQQLLAFASLYHSARHKNEIVTMQRIKNMILDMLCQKGYGNLFVLAHVVALAE